MIVFDLACFCGYHFEGWFQDHDDFNAQLDSSLILCPDCGSSNVRKVMSAVAVRTGGSVRCDDSGTEPHAETVAEQAAAFLHRIQDYVEKNFEDVGSKLPEEALKIHYGVKKARNIRGIATHEEEESLNNEGIQLMKIPMLKKEAKKLN